MSEIQSFDSLDDAMNRLRRQMVAADAQVLPWQVRIKPNDYFRRESGFDFLIYGHVLEEEEPREPGLEHYRLCRCYSVACPEGELGDVHVSTIDQLISKGTFDQARSRRWIA